MWEVVFIDCIYSLPGVCFFNQTCIECDSVFVLAILEPLETNSDVTTQLSLCIPLRLVAQECWHKMPRMCNHGEA